MKERFIENWNICLRLSVYSLWKFQVSELKQPDLFTSFPQLKIYIFPASTINFSRKIVFFRNGLSINQYHGNSVIWM